ncbi:MAG TPA: TatD family deoxyribonuclease [Candidatus Lambdaproteobacteria bacterium]|jgi:TatD DNase family protein|nr:TatD family hydrolase [SAR324 cluster bacterium]HBL55612.1 hydrolase TatD [Deltaproteobacteria bacterium]HHZ77814.1 TatD family deoxyribonuclease [Candidatus Lambdaproteobacteria bacterium]HIA56463.1 TatD family deoxyribonuclease [Candidatus Lambdaproteobacteria bacterium]HIB45238.1 TatD family deoxyribonuclease [Candidatus Lambdaproteobacteria bacterium]
MTSFIDTHCHLDKLESTPEEAVIEAKDAGVQRMLTISVDESSLDFVSNAVRQFTEVFGSVGFHPHDASALTEALEDRIRKLAQEEKKLVAIGETGLDYHYMYSPVEVQQQVFRKQLRLAEELNLPVVMHSREAETDTLKILKDIPVKSLGVAHSFTSSFEMARTLVEMGWYLGINGIVTFKNAEDLREVVRWLPLDKLLLETDSPFLAPIPFRGKPNKPAHIPAIATFIAELRDISLQELAEQTSENAQRLFNFDV